MFPALERVFEAAGCKTQIELAIILNIRQSSISDAKRRSAIPAEWLIKLLKLKGINPEWILTGEGSKYLIPSESEPIRPYVSYVVEVRPPEKCTAQDLVTELVRRALDRPDFDELQKQAADTWFPVEKFEQEPGGDGNEQK